MWVLLIKWYGEPKCDIVKFMLVFLLMWKC